jgi:hypothetical protein
MASRCFFPLRTSVELFDDATSPRIESRIKQAAVLYDELLFERGMYEATATTDHLIEHVHAPENVTDQQIARANRRDPHVHALRTVIEIDHPDIPPLVSEGRITGQYAAEFEFSLISRLTDFNDGWVTLLDIADLKRDAFLAESPRQLRPRSDNADDHRLEAFALNAFQRDQAAATFLGADFNISPLFAPAAGHLTHTATENTLTYLCPYVGQCPWEQIAEFRAHDAAQHARQLLWDWHKRAEQHGPEAAGSALQRELQAATLELRERFQFVSHATEIAVSTVVPQPVGPLLGKAVALLRERTQREAIKRSPAAALMKLNPQR